MWRNTSCAAFTDISCPTIWRDEINFLPANMMIPKPQFNFFKIKTPFFFFFFLWCNSLAFNIFFSIFWCYRYKLLDSFMFEIQSFTLCTWCGLPFTNTYLKATSCPTIWRVEINIFFLGTWWFKISNKVSLSSFFEFYSNT